ncbi:MAG: hypothetical protein KF779_09020 [Hyphomonadaceae bacterium]|nr:hypothetical protein [Hyphomonadaceae bacterium]
MTRRDNLAHASDLEAEQTTIREAQEYTIHDFFDPAAAQFRNVRMIENGNVCGEVNGKNRFGGYVGFRPFVYWADREIRAEIAMNNLEALNPDKTDEALARLSERENRGLEMCRAF